MKKPSFRGWLPALAPPLLMALALSLTLAVPVFAAGEASSSGSGGGSGSGGETPPRVELTVAVDPPSLTLTAGSFNLTAVVHTAGSESLPSDLTYRWEITAGGDAVVFDSGTDAQSINIKPSGTPGEAAVSVTVASAAASNSPSAVCTVLSPGLSLSTPSISVDERKTTAVAASVYLPAGLASNDITWTSDSPEVATVSNVSTNLDRHTTSATITGVSAGFAAVTVNAGSDYSATLDVHVNEIEVTDIYSSATLDSPLSLASVGSEINSRCQDKLGGGLAYISALQAPTGAGTLYYGYQSEAQQGSGVASSDKYYYRDGNGSLLDDVSFVPKPGYSGTANIRYTAYTSSGASFQGSIQVDVESTSGIQYSTVGRQRVDFNANDFNAACRSATGFDLNCVQFSLPSASRGTLYYNYTGSELDNKVSSSTWYYRSKTPRVEDVTFVADADYSGTLTLSYQGKNTNGGSFSGTVEITVSEVNGSGSGDISYSTKKNRSMDFDVDDFDNYCRSETGNRLDYVRFTTPGSSQGTLYYNYTSSSSTGGKVSSGTRYYRNSYPYVDDITFVPRSGYTGEVRIPFTGYSSGDEYFSGTVNITVGSDSSSSRDLRYTVKRNREAEFDVDDFDDYCEELTGRRLNYVRFDLPASSRGTLRYNYSSSSSTGSAVSSSTSYYRSSSPYLDNVSFVPKSGWTGTVDVDFTGWDTSGERFTGTVEIEVEEGASSGGAIAYTTTQETAVHFKTADFNDLCDDETGRDLNYVRFDPPSSSRGTLYYNYTSSSSTGGKISSSTSYYRNSSPYISNLTFVPAKGYTGTVDVGFSGWAVNGEKFTGTVEVTVKSDNAGPIYYSTRAGAPVRFQLSSFQSACSARGAGSFTSAAFTPPSASVGRLWQGYESAAQPGGAVAASQTYRAAGSPLVSEITFVPAAGFTGTAALAYTGTDSRGKSYSGTVSVSVTGTPASTFTDMGGYAWAAPAVEYLSASGVVTGTGGGKFSPGASITRGSFMLMLDRAYRFPAAAGAGFSDVPSTSVYADAVRKAKALGIAEGAGGKFRPKNPMTRQQAAVFLARAMRVNGWTITEGTRAELAGFTDGASVSSYAVGPLSAMVRLGVFQGNSAGRLNPNAPLTRAQMAVILYRAMTL